MYEEIDPKIEDIIGIEELEEDETLEASENADKFYLNKLLSHDIFYGEEESKLAYHMVDCYNNIISIIKSTPYIMPVLETIISEKVMENVDKNKIRNKIIKFQTKWNEIENSISRINGDQKKYNQYIQKLKIKRDEIKNIHLEDYLRLYISSISSQFIELMEEALQTKKGLPQFKISYKELKLLYNDFYKNYEDYNIGVNSFVEHNQKLVYKRVLKQRFNKNFDSIKPDLLQEGNIGLLRAIHGFDPKRNNKFSTYAVPWIDQCVQRYIDDYGRLIDIPVYILEESRRVQNVSKKLENQLNRNPTAYEIANEINMTEEQVEKLILLPKAVPNIQILRDDDRDIELTDSIGDETFSPERIVTSKISEQEMEGILRELKPREEMVIRLRFGFGCDKHTLEEIGGEWGVSRERIRQIEAKALRRLRLKIPKYYKEQC